MEGFSALNCPSLAGCACRVVIMRVNCSSSIPRTCVFPGGGFAGPVVVMVALLVDTRLVSSDSFSEFSDSVVGLPCPVLLMTASRASPSACTSISPSVRSTSGGSLGVKFSVLSLGVAGGRYQM